MKPIKTKTFLVQHLLIATAVTLAVIGFMLSAKTLPFFPSVEAVTVDGITHIEINKGTILFSHAAIFLAFLCAYLVFEFYGFKPAFYTSINIACMIAMTYGLFWFINRYVLDPQKSHTDLMLSQITFFNFSTLIALSSAVAGGFTSTFMIAASVKKLTRNYLMFIRYPIAAVIGFSVFTAIYTFITGYNLSAYQTMLLDSITPLSHFVALILVSVVPLYLLRLALVLFRGRMKDDETLETGNTLYKGSDNTDILPVPPVKPHKTAVGEQTEEAEITISEKVSLEPKPHAAVCSS